MQPFFTTNDNEISRLEGLYLKERNPAATVKGASLNTVGIVGDCVRGPVNKAVECSSEARFKEVFGGRDQGSGGALLGKVWKTLVNKPFGKVVVWRAAAAAAVAASFTLETATGGGGTAVLRVDAANVGTWGNNVGVSVKAATDGDANHFDLLVRYLGNVYRFKNLDIHTSGVDNTLAAVGTDDGNLIVLTKLASGRPVNTTAATDGADSDTTGGAVGYILLGATVAAFTSVAGTDGTIAATDFTASGKGMELLNAYKGVGICMVADPVTAQYAAIKTKIATLAAATSDRLWVCGADDETVSLSTAATDAGTMLSDRIVYCFNAPYTMDPETASEMVTRPESWMASILSQTDVDIHPGEEDSKQYTAGITRLYNEALAREDYITLHNAGVSALEKDQGFAFVSGVVTSQTPGKSEITRRRMADYLVLGAAGFLKFSVKKKNLKSRRQANKAALSAWLRDLAKGERVVDQDDTGLALFSVDTEKLNTTNQRAAGIEKILMTVKLIGHMLSVVLESEIGTGVTIQIQ